MPGEFRVRGQLAPAFFSGLIIVAARPEKRRASRVPVCERKPLIRRHGRRTTRNRCPIRCTNLPVLYRKWTSGIARFLLSYSLFGKILFGFLCLPRLFAAKNSSRTRTTRTDSSAGNSKKATSPSVFPSVKIAQFREDFSCAGNGLATFNVQLSTLNFQLSVRLNVER